MSRSDYAMRCTDTIRFRKKTIIRESFTRWLVRERSHSCKGHEWDIFPSPSPVRAEGSKVPFVGSHHFQKFGSKKAKATTKVTNEPLKMWKKHGLKQDHLADFIHIVKAWFLFIGIQRSPTSSRNRLKNVVRN